jgi:outer membrane protein OmpA-like peptidoglycan-associated protein
MRALHFLTVLLTFLFGLSSASANDVEVTVMNKVLHGQDKPSITLTFNKAVRDATVELKGIGSRTQRYKIGKKRAGQSFKATIDAPVGQYEVRGNLSVVFSDGATGEMPLQFAVVVAAPMTIEVPHERIFQTEGRVEVLLNRPANYCDANVLYENGARVQERTVFEGAQSGDWLSVRWPIPKAMAGQDHVVMKIKLNCFDVDYFSNGIELSPWWLEIPHDDVIFSSGSSVIEDGERAKIDNVLPEIQSAIDKFGKLIPLALYISGHTDTVGDAGANKKLARQRAQAIAGYLKAAGIRVSLHYRGTGETELAVETGDNVDEPRNRRARYILSNGAPDRHSWKQL